jgi:predicted nuclease of predicted toxin-antitoxin system
VRLLIDECAPRALKSFLVGEGHDCLSVQEAGWAGKRNGELLKLAEGRFDVFITLDTNLQYQQNMVGRQIGIIVIRAQSNRLNDLKPYFSDCIQALEVIQAGQMVHIGSTKS